MTSRSPAIDCWPVVRLTLPFRSTTSYSCSHTWLSCLSCQYIFQYRNELQFCTLQFLHHRTRTCLFRVCNNNLYKHISWCKATTKDCFVCPAVRPIGCFTISWQNKRFFLFLSTVEFLPMRGYDRQCLFYWTQTL